ncbi:MAG: hypothetical protein WCN27_05635, partial [Alphaproteobacteria bacterium]
GDINGYVASKKISSHRETYRLEFASVKGRLFLKSFKVLKSDQEIYQDTNLEPNSQTNVNSDATQEGK